MYQIAEIERGGNCRSRNLNFELIHIECLLNGYCVKDASIAICENAQASELKLKLKFMFGLKGLDRSIYEISVLISVSPLYDFRLFELFYKL